MLKNCSLIGVLLLAVCMPISEATFAGQAADTDRAIQALLDVGPGSQGAAAAREALSQLQSAGAEQLIPLLKAFKEASPLSANWLRNAFDGIAGQQTAAGENLPAFELVSFVKDTSESPVARRLAYEWLLKQDESLKSKLIPGMLMDPSPEFRRDAVEMWMDKAKAESDSESAVKSWQEALRGAVHEDQVKEIDKALEAAGQDVDIQGHFGFLTEWQMIGPFDNKDEKGFAVAYPPETSVALDAEYDGQLGRVKWQAVTTEDDFGVVDIAKQIENYKGSLMYAAATFDCGHSRSAELRLGTPNAWKLWLNGQLVFDREEYHRSSQMDQYKVPVQLKAGANQILIKICQNEQTQDWAQRYQFQFRVCDSTGVGIRPALNAAQRELSSEGVK